MKNAIFAALTAVAMTSSVSAQTDILKPVKVLKIEAENEGTTRHFFGKVVAKSTVDLAFQVGGQILELAAVEGEQIAKGELIARLDTEQAMRLVRVALEDAQTAALLAEVDERNADYSLKHATLTAPFDALVSDRLVQNFTTIAAGTAVVRLHDMSELRIEIEVPEVLFQRAGEDPDLTVTAEFPASDRVFPIEIREFSAEASSVGQSFKITFGLSQPEDLRVLPGSSVTVKATLAPDHSTFLVPAEALLTHTDGTFSAMVFEPINDLNGTIKRVPVTARPHVTGKMEIVSGLDVGTEIVAMGASTLTEGDTVRRFLGFGQ
ncbi:hypothetical protein GQR58_030238 [Nymphon striatum]|nr:hypothetical protein GQR58_030238 [Nymphon striatum]